MKYRLSTFLVFVLVSGVLVAWLANGFRNRLPAHWKNVPGDGIDTMVGQIESEKLPIKIDYDIGPFAGEYARTSSSRKTKWIKEGTARNCRFVYMLDENDVLYVTYPDEGPANFWASIQKETEIDVIVNLLSNHRNELLGFDRE